MRRREFLRRAIGGIAAVAGVPVALRARPANPGFNAGPVQTYVSTWERRLTAAECSELYNMGAGVSLQVFQSDLVGSNFFSRNFRTDAVDCALPESATSNRTDEESHDVSTTVRP